MGASRRIYNPRVLAVAGAVVIAMLAATEAFDPWLADASSDTPQTAEVRTRAGVHAFLQDGVTGPAAWSSCRPIRFVKNFDLAPPGADAAFDDAIQQTARATGLRLEVVGNSTDGPSEPVREGKPVLVVWSTPLSDPELAGDVAGYATPLIQGGTVVPQIVAGRVVLDRDQVLRAGIGTEPYNTLLHSVILHELGHLVGLDHVSSRDEIMHPSDSDVTSFQPGDLEGLKALGKGPC